MKLHIFVLAPQAHTITTGRKPRMLIDSVRDNSRITRQKTPGLEKRQACGRPGE
jgi:hypothetical protein